MTREQAELEGSELADDGIDELETASREEILELLEDGVREAHKKAVSGRVYDSENEKVRQGWLQRLGYLAKQYNSILDARENERFDEMEEQVEALAEQLDGSSDALRTDGGESGE